MADQVERPPVWPLIVGAVVVVLLILGVLQIIDWIFSLPFLVLAIVGGGGYLWYRSRHRASV